MTKTPVCLILSCLAAAVMTACGAGIVEPEPPAPNFIRLQSDAGDYIGGGATHTYTQANAVIAVLAVGGRLEITVTGDEQWSGRFQSMSTQSRLEAGTQANLTRYPFHDPVTGGLIWDGEGRGCNTLTGSFTIDSVTYTGDILSAIDLSFVQHCEGGAAALHGTIHWRSDDNSEAPGPVTPIPASLWKPAAGSTPSSGNYLYLQSVPGDYVGQGGTYTYLPSNATLAIQANGTRLSIHITGAQQWFGEFQTMNTLSLFQPGYYADLRRYPFHNPAKGGLTWFGEGRGCNTLTGWFAVDASTYVNSTLTSIDLRFEQHCEGSVPALRGAIHWSG